MRESHIELKSALKIIGYGALFVAFLLIFFWPTAYGADNCVGPFESPTCNYIRCMEGECK